MVCVVDHQSGYKVPLGVQGHWGTRYSVSRILGHDSGIRSLFLENALKDAFALLVCVVYMCYSPRTAGASLKKHYTSCVFKLSIDCDRAEFTQTARNIIETTVSASVKNLQPVHITSKHQASVRGFFHIRQALLMHQIQPLSHMHRP